MPSARMERSPDSGYRPLFDEPIGQIELSLTETVFATGTKEPILQIDGALWPLGQTNGLTTRTVPYRCP